MLMDFPFWVLLVLGSALTRSNIIVDIHDYVGPAEPTGLDVSVFL
jgi:hypothetical protein